MQKCKVKRYLEGNFGLGVQNKAAQRLTELCQENTLIIATQQHNNTREDPTHARHHMVNTKTRLIIFFAAKDGEALYSEKKQDWGLIVVQIINPYCPK